MTSGNGAVSGQTTRSSCPAAKSRNEESCHGTSCTSTFGASRESVATNSGRRRIVIWSVMASFRDPVAVAGLGLPLPQALHFRQQQSQFLKQRSRSGRQSVLFARSDE